MIITDKEALDIASIKAGIRQVADHPKPGICFYDITTLWKDPQLFQLTLDKLQELVKPFKANKVAGIEARGFVFAAALADRLKLGFVPLRKAGKLPADSIKEGYNLEYGNDHLEIHNDAIETGDNILLIDDLIATGGSLTAAARLVEHLGGNISAIACLIGLDFLPTNPYLQRYDLRCVINYDK